MIEIALLCAGVEILKHYDAYEQALKVGRNLTLKYLKFLFFGPPRSGKTSTRRRLLQEIVNLSISGEHSASTPMADTHDVAIKTHDLTIKKIAAESAVVSGSRWKSLKSKDKRDQQLDLYDEEEIRYVAHLFYQHIQMSLNIPPPTSDTHGPTPRQDLGLDLSHDSFLDPTPRHDPGQDSLLYPLSVPKVQNPTQTKAYTAIGLIEQEALDAIDKLKSILKSDSPKDLQQVLKDLIMINMMDVGGQPAFLDMLPTLTIGPALYLLFFQLNQKFDECCQVKFHPVDAKKDIEISGFYSTKEVLYQCLASISCFCSQPVLKLVSKPLENSDSLSESQTPQKLQANSGSGSEPRTLQANFKSGLESRVPVQSSRLVKSHTNCEAPEMLSRILLFGTFRDKVTSKDVELMEKYLQNELKGTVMYENDILLKSSKNTVICTVDNMKGTEESEMSAIREDIEGKIRKYFPSFVIPVSWLMFRTVLHLLNKPVITRALCKEIATKLSVKQEIEVVLWFFHHNVGTLMHYSNIPSMKDIVICNPQVIFDSISKLIINKFRYDEKRSSNIKQHEVDYFYETGQFSLSHIKDITGCPYDQKTTESQETCLLNLEQLIDLLKHLNIIAEVKHDNKEDKSEVKEKSKELKDESNKEAKNSKSYDPKFIMPAVLKYEELEPLKPSAASTELHASPLMFHFEGGFVPFGVFSASVARLIASNDLEWHLCKDQVKRNKVMFFVGGAFRVSFISQPQWLKVTVSKDSGARMQISELDIYPIVRQVLSETVSTVVSNMQYKSYAARFSPCKQSFTLAFICTCKEGSSSDHPMKVLKDKDGQYYAKCCKQEGNPRNLYNEHTIWFTEPQGNGVL